MFFCINFAGQMKKTIYNKFDKTKIASLPRVLFGGRIVVVCTEREAEKAVNYLMSQKILGVDTETRPSFKKGLMHPVSLLQVSSHEVCFLFRLNLLGMSPSVRRLLEDTKVPKIGLRFATTSTRFTSWTISRAAISLTCKTMCAKSASRT